MKNDARNKMFASIGARRYPSRTITAELGITTLRNGRDDVQCMVSTDLDAVTSRADSVAKPDMEITRISRTYVQWRKALIGQTLGELSRGRQNNLNLIRMLLASAVIISHSATISRGPRAVEPLQDVLHISLGALAVYGFFAISGFLVTQSLFNREDVISYVRARCLRIFPGLAVVLLVTMSLLGPSVTSLSLAEFASSKRTWTYFPANLTLYHLQDSLPGVFETNAIPSTINGSLWTLRFEFDCYIALAAIWIIGGFRTRNWIRQPVISMVAVGMFAAAVELHRNGVHQPVYILFYSFTCGTAAYLWRDRIRLSRTISLIAIVIAASLNFFVPCPTLLCTVYFYALLAFGFQKSPRLEWYNTLGDYSYGTYIYAFPIQQTIAWAIPGTSPIGMFLLAFPITVLMAVLSWKFVERPALALKCFQRTQKGKPLQGVPGMDGSLGMHDGRKMDFRNGVNFISNSRIILPTVRSRQSDGRNHRHPAL